MERLHLVKQNGLTVSWFMLSLACEEKVLQCFRNYNMNSRKLKTEQNFLNYTYKQNWTLNQKVLMNNKC